MVDLCKSKLKKLVVNIGNDLNAFRVHFPPIASSVQELLVFNKKPEAIMREAFKERDEGQGN